MTQEVIDYRRWIKEKWGGKAPPVTEKVVENVRSRYTALVFLLCEFTCSVHLSADCFLVTL